MWRMNVMSDPRSWPQVRPFLWPIKVKTLALSQIEATSNSTKNRPRVDIITRDRILSTENEEGLARLPVPHPPGPLDGGLIVGCLGILRFLVGSRQFLTSSRLCLKSDFLSFILRGEK